MISHIYFFGIVTYIKKKALQYKRFILRSGSGGTFKKEQPPPKRSPKHRAIQKGDKGVWIFRWQIEFSHCNLPWLYSWIPKEVWPFHHNIYPSFPLITKKILMFVFSASLDIAFTWKVRNTMSYFQILRYVLKLVAAAIWTIILPVYYARSRRNSTCSTKSFTNGNGEWCLSSYMVAVAIYLSSNVIGMILFFVPALSSYIETSNCRLCTILSWWAQVSFLHDVVFAMALSFVHKELIEFCWITGLLGVWTRKKILKWAFVRT